MQKSLKEAATLIGVIGIGAATLYTAIMSYQCAANKEFTCPPPFSWAFKPPAPKPITPHNAYTEAQLIGIIRGTGARCKEPAIVTPTTIPNGTNYLVACNIGTHEITITQGSEPIVKTLKFK